MNLNEIIKRILSSIILLPIIIFLIIKGSYLFNLLIILSFFISSYEWFKMSKKLFYTILGIFCLMISFYSIFKLRNEFDNNYSYLLLVFSFFINALAWLPIYFGMRYLRRRLL